MIVAVGHEIVDVVEFRKRLTDELVREVFLPEEIAYCDSRARPWESYAARLAAKRALFLALGVVPDPQIAWHDVEVVRRGSGDVCIESSGNARRGIHRINATRVHVSMAHTRFSASALVVLERCDTE